MSKKLIISAGALVVALSLCYAYGMFFIPAKQTSWSHAYLNADRQDVWNLITYPNGFPSWRSDVEQVNLTSNGDGLFKWEEIDKTGKTTFYTESRGYEPHRWVIFHGDTEGELRGTRTILLREEDGGTRIFITDTGTTANPIIRLCNKLFIRSEGIIEAYLTDIASQFGQKLDFDEEKVEQPDIET